MKTSVDLIAILLILAALCGLILKAVSSVIAFFKRPGNDECFDVFNLYPYERGDCTGYDETEFQADEPFDQFNIAPGHNKE